MNRILYPLLFLIFAGVWTAGAQNNAHTPHFTVQVDTIWIDASDYVTATCKFEMQRSAKCRDYYFCCFRQTEYNTTNIAKKNHLLAISSDGKTIRKVPMPSDFDNDHYFNLFARNDTLYIKPYWELRHTHYRFDYDKWDWEPTTHLSDVVCEDAYYQIVLKDYGEWGRFVWFIDKQSNNQYLSQGYSTRIVPCLGKYYCLSNGLLQWTDPTKGLLCVDSLKHNSEKALASIAEIQHSELMDYYVNGKPPKTSFGDAEQIFNIQGRENDNEKEWWWEGKIYDTVFQNMISLNNQLYFWTKIKDSTYITTIEDGKLIKITYVPGNYRFFSSSIVDRGCNIAPNRFVKQFRVDPWTYGLVDMADSTILIHYLIHNQDTLQFSGKDNVKPLLEFLMENKDHLTLSAVDSVERLLNGVPSTLLKNVYEEEHYNTKRQPDEDYVIIRYFKLVDTSLVVESCYYFDRKDSIVDEFEIILHKANYYNSNVIHRGERDFNPTLSEELKDYFTHIVGEQPVKDKYHSAWCWTLNGHKLTLQSHRIFFGK